MFGRFSGRAGFGAVALCWALLAMVPVPEAQAQDQVLNLRDADIRAFIADVAMMTGRTFIVDPRVTGRVTVVSSEPVTESDVMEIFMATLGVQGFTAIPTANGVYKVVPEEAAAQSALPLEGKNLPGSAFVTAVIRLHNVDPVPVLNMIKPLVHRQGNVVANRGGDSIIVVDTAENLKRIREIITRLDTDNSVTRTVALDRTAASEMSKIVKEIMARADGEFPRQGVEVVPVPAGNLLVLKGDARTVERLARMVTELDKSNTSRSDLKVIYLKHADAEQLVPLLEKVSASVAAAGKPEGGTAPAAGRANIAFDKGTNSLVIAAEPSMQATLVSVISQLDVRRAQVLVEAIIVEVSDTAARDLGLQFVLGGTDGSNIPFTVTNYSNTAPNILAATGAVALDEKTNASGDTLDDLRQTALNSLLGIDGFATGIGGITNGGTLFGVILTALQRDVASNVLSTPSVMTMNNEEASIIVGQEIPITTGETLGADNSNPFRTIERQDVGVQLDVRPQINEGDTVKLFIRQEVSSIAGPISSNSTELVTDKREIETTVLVDDGEVIVLGGLIQNDERISVDKVPFLGDIPVLGRAFQSKSKSRQRTNLMVFLRPTIVRGADDMRQVSGRKYNYMRAEQLLQNQGKGTDLDTFMNEVMGATPQGTGTAGEAGE